jgi:hypothetical protein
MLKVVLLFIIYLCWLISLDAEKEIKSFIVVMQMMPKNVTPHQELSMLSAYNFAQANGYEYRLIKTKLSEYILEDWHESWFVADSIRQILLNGTIDALVYIDTFSFYHDIEKPLHVRLKEFEQDIFFSYAYKSSCQSTNMTDCIVQFPNVQIWKNTPLVEIILDDWIQCPSKLLECFVYASKESPYAYAAFEGMLQQVLPTNIIGYLPCQVHETNIIRNQNLVIPLPVTNITQYCALFFNEQSANSLNHSLLLAPWLSLIPTITTNLLLHDILPTHTHTLIFRDGYCQLECFRDVFRKMHPNKKTYLEVETLVAADDKTLHHLRDDQCNNQMDNETCNVFVDFITSNQEIRQKNITRCQVEKAKSRFLSRFQQAQQELQSSYTMQDFHNQERLIALQPSRTIVTVFAGRYDRLSLMLQYWRLALQAELVHEIHLWDFCRNETDRKLLNRFPMDDKRIKIFYRSTSRRCWEDYYEHYDTYAQSHPQDVIIKCDDDILFIDLHMLPYFLNIVRAQKKPHKYVSKNGEPLGGVVFANIINNGVASYYQQNLLGLLPPPNGSSIDSTGIFHGEEFDYPEGGLEGSLWANATKAELMHLYFMTKWKDLLPSPLKLITFPARTKTAASQYAPLKYHPEIIPIKTRFSINFFGIHASQWYLIRDIGEDDELHLTVTLPEEGYFQNILCSNFIVSHLSFNSQAKNMSTEKIVAGYRVLFDEYAQPMRASLNISNERAVGAI